AGPKEPSYFCCYDKLRDTYTGSSYSNIWIENTETADTLKETMQEQYEYIKNKSYKTVISGEIYYEHTQQYGDLTIGKLPVSEFLGAKKSINQMNDGKIATFDNSCEVVSKREAAVHLLQKKIDRTSDNNEKLGYVNELSRLLSGRQSVDKHMSDYNPYVLGKLQTFVNICETMRESSDADIAVNQLIQHCSQYTSNQFGYVL
ncbi:unnamed protein product, partial [Medioppia subpectinata]